MLTLQNTMRAGARFEDELVSMITRYSRNIWRNVRVETLLTQSGTTEIDILFCYKNLVFIVEAKNVSAVFGDYYDGIWSFIGASTPNKESRSYTKLNVIVQNNIHARSFKDLFFAYFQDWPVVVPVIVVPNNCRVAEGLDTVILTASDLETMLSQLSREQVHESVQRRVASIIPGDKCTVLRPDFVTSPATGQRQKAIDYMRGV